MASPVLVMPRRPAQWGGAAALWVTVAGWSGALRRRGFEPVVLTPSGLVSESDCLEATAVNTTTAPAAPRSKAVATARVLAKDLDRAIAMRRYSAAIRRMPEMEGVTAPFVWQHHDLFHRAGERLAGSRDIPLIEYVHAPVVWEARRWGVTRPVWGDLLQRLGEVPNLRAADLVCCVSSEVRDAVVELGVAPDRALVSPMGVDPERFFPGADGTAWRERYGDIGDFVFGWIGSFRRFHAIELAVQALAALRADGCRAGLVLAGTGQDLARIEGTARSAGVAEYVRFVGQVDNREMPKLLASLDAAVITAASEQAFHYSPLKLREYLAAGLPVVVPSLGEIPQLVSEDAGVLYDAGDASDLAAGLRRLAGDTALRARLGAAGRDRVLAAGTWDVLVAEALHRLRLS